MPSLKMSIEEKFIHFLVTLAKKENEDFSGAGFVLYHDLNLLSEYHCNLVNHHRALPLLQLGTEDFNAFIVKISNINHACHDGFHFISASGILTHIAQFFSPPASKLIHNIKGQGARTFCTQAGSMLNGVTLVGSVSTNKNIYIFEKGKLIDTDHYTNCQNPLRYSTCS